MFHTELVSSSCVQYYILEITIRNVGYGENDKRKEMEISIMNVAIW